MQIWNVNNSFFSPNIAAVKEEQNTKEQNWNWKISLNIAYWLFLLCLSIWMRCASVLRVYLFCMVSIRAKNSIYLKNQSIAHYLIACWWFSEYVSNWHNYVNFSINNRSLFLKKKEAKNLHRRKTDKLW